MPKSNNKILILSEKNETGSQLVSCLNDPKLGNNWEKLKQKASKDGFLEGDEYLVTFAKGHLFGDKLPSQINPDYGLFNHLENPKDYRLEDLLPSMQRVPSKDANKAKQRNIFSL